MHPLRLFMSQHRYPDTLEQRAVSCDDTTAPLSLLYEISRTLIAGGSLRELLSRLLNRTVAALHATRGSILVLQNTHEEDGYIIRAGAGVASTAQDLTRVLREGVAAHVIASRQTALIDDVRHDPRWVQSSIDQGTVTPRAALVVPLVNNDVVTGVLTLWHTEPGYFSPADVELMNAVAAQAAMAIERTTAHEQAQRRADELATLHDAALDIATATNLDALLARMAERAARLVASDRTNVFLLHEQQQELELVASHNVPMPAVGYRLKLGEGAAGRAALHRQIVHIKSYRDWPEHLPAFNTLPDQTVLSVPLLLGERVVGVIT
ncbi:MAG: GAF domain-containing protein, partial [Chloroflexaceae bacterium]|nr:GAF domain-containing protein [Chloroflexaceae bacterium]